MGECEAIVQAGKLYEKLAEQGDIMIKILGLDLQQVAKQYLEDLDKENNLQKED